MNSVVVGKYRITESPTPGKVWIDLVDDGEGMETEVRKLEAVLDRFYEAEF